MIKSDSEFLQFALSKYDNPHLLSIKEFEGDIARFVYINNLLNRYCRNSADLKHRLLINHYVILSNCFTVAGSIKMCEYKIREEFQPQSATIMYYLGWIDSAPQLDFTLLDILQNDKL